MYKIILTGDKENELQANPFELHLKEKNEINLEKTYTSDEEALKEVPYFEFSVEGKYKTPSVIEYNIYLEEIEESKISKDLVKVNLIKMEDNEEQEVLKTTKVSDLETYEKESQRLLYKDTLEFSRLNQTPTNTYRLRSWVMEAISDFGDYGDIEGGSLIIEPETYKFRINVAVEELEKGVNPPILLDNMIPVIYDEKQESWIKTTENNWYNYTKKEWANAVTLDTTKAYDLSKNKNHVPISGPTKVDNGLKFDGVDDYIDIGFANKEFTNGFTIVVNFILNEMINEPRIITNTQDSGTTFYIQSNKKIAYVIHDGTGYKDIPNTGIIELNKPYEVIATFDNTDAKLYLNGSLIGSYHWDTPTQMKTSPMPFSIGAEPDPGVHIYNAPITLQEARLYERALTEEEVTKLYNNEEVSDKGLLSYYNFADEFKPGQAIDMNMITTMWVWIPRYKYRIFNANLTGGEVSEEQEIEITFEKDKETTGTVRCMDNINNSDGTSETCEDKTNGEIKNGVSTYTHPAFTFGDKELTGFWYGKFENGLESSNLVIKPDVTINNNKALSTFFQETRKMELQNNIYGFPSNATAYTATGDLTGDDNNLDTHLTKNMEWGAVAYLTQSKYGRCENGNCSETYANNSNQYTGRSGGTNKLENTAYSTYGAYSYDDYVIDNTNKKTTKDKGKGVGASTTGNIYGIYDMSGGLWDTVMTGIRGQDVTATGFTSYPNKKYYDEYSNGTTRWDVAAYKRCKLGDATKEVIKILNIENGGWHGDGSNLIRNTIQVFYRGGGAVGSVNAESRGIFQFDSNTGYASSALTDRSVLVIY